MISGIKAALQSLDGLSTGDAFGEQYFFFNQPKDDPTVLPPGIWNWTDDTHMALSIVETLREHGRIEQDFLAQRFAQRYKEEPFRGYAGGAARLLEEIHSGESWRERAPLLFGNGSFGNGAAMRVAPVGGFFSNDLQRAANEARLTAEITHSHPEGIAGAIAVSVAAAIAASDDTISGMEFLDAVIQLVPESITRQQIVKATTIPAGQLSDAMLSLGTGMKVSSQDTVPFCLWIAAWHLSNYEMALRQTVRGKGDCDTTSAIVGGIVALRSPVPVEWLKEREPIPRL